jgi:hypothetical protein
MEDSQIGRDEVLSVLRKVGEICSWIAAIELPRKSRETARKAHSDSRDCEETPQNHLLHAHET